MATVNGSVKIGSVAKIPIRVHWTFAILFFLIWHPGMTLSQALPGVAWIAVLFACVVIHELSHCAMARRRGLPVQDIVLLPLGGVSQIGGLTSAGPKTERDVAVVGPLTNFVIAGVLFLVTLAMGGHIWPPVAVVGPWTARVAWLNVLLGAFNLLPALPMDGGRILRAVLSARGGNLRATRIASGVAMFVGALMIAGGLRYGDYFLAAIGLLVILGALGERRMAVVKDAISNIQVGNVMAQDPTSVLSEVTVGQLAPWLAGFPGRAVPIVEAGNFVGIVGMEELLSASPYATVGEAADRRAPVLDASQAVYPDAINAFASTPRLQLAVMSGGRIVGVLYRWTLQNLLNQYQSASPRNAGSPVG
jgi:Zn-dependent protease